MRSQFIYLVTSAPKYFSEIFAMVPSAWRSARALSTAAVSSVEPLRKTNALSVLSGASAATFRPESGVFLA
ncbi:hypothetical protein D3C78_1965410 [compost metagenome]